MAKKKCERIKHISYILGDSMTYKMSTPLKNLNVDTVDLLLLVVGKIFLTAAARWSRHHRQRQVLRRAKAAKDFNFLIFNQASFNNFAFFIDKLKRIRTKNKEHIFIRKKIPNKKHFSML